MVLSYTLALRTGLHPRKTQQHYSNWGFKTFPLWQESWKEIALKGDQIHHNLGQEGGKPYPINILPTSNTDKKSLQLKPTRLWLALGKPTQSLFGTFVSLN